MRISLNWLKDYIDYGSMAPKDIAHALTDIGLEVETMETISPIKGEVVVGKILDAQKHPDADTLRVCQVDVGAAEGPLEIVCGAPNARAGIKVCVALIGSTLPGDFKIKKSKIRGVTSNGMLCAEDELGLSSNHDTIIEVAENVNIGASVSKLFKLEDTVLTLGVTPNRGDCLGYLGVARDLSARLGIPLILPQHLPKNQDNNFSTSKNLKLKVSSDEDCPRFCALSIDQVGTWSSPQWLRTRLELSGMRPINALVDVTNYVMLEMGQPLHAYDARDLGNNTIIVRRGRAGEPLTTLDEQSRILSEEDILICDDQRVIGIAGVMGGANTEIKADTTSIVLEVASFDARRVRKTGKRLGLHTEASHRFERGTDIANCNVVVLRCAALLEAIALETKNPTPRISGDVIDFYPKPAEPLKVALRCERARRILGLQELTPTLASTTLARLGINLIDQATATERLLLAVPSWRRDITREIDLIEEIGRIVGYDRIPTRLPQMEIANFVRENPIIRFIDDSRRSAAQLGFTEAVTFPFVGSDLRQKLRINDDHPLAAQVTLANPIAEQESTLRTSVAMTLLQALAANRRHGTQGARLFECGRTYHSANIPPNDFVLTPMLQQQGLHISDRASKDLRCVERNQIAFVIDQPWLNKSWNSPEVKAGFFHGRMVVESFVSQFYRQPVSFTSCEAKRLTPFLHPSSTSLVMVEGTPIGFCGELHPAVALSLDFDPKAAPVVIELSLDALFSATRKTPTITCESEKFPPVNFDLALVVDRSLRYENLHTAITEIKNKRNLRSVKLFDVYEGANIPADKKSMAISLRFQSPKRTLSDQEVQDEVKLILDALKESVGATLR